MTGIGVVASGLGWLAKTVIGLGKQWTLTVERLTTLTDKVSQIVDWKDREHTRLDTRADRLDGRIERHEAWHDDHPHHP